MDDEAKRAAHYEANKDDQAEWGDAAPASPRRRRRLDSMLSVRLSPDEVDAVRSEAERLGVTVSAFMRQAALQAAHPMRSLPASTAPTQVATPVKLVFTSMPTSMQPDLAGATPGSLIPC